jgi:HK97 family phage prohead protease
MTKLITVDQFRKELRAGAKPSDAVFRISTELPVAVEGADRTLRFCFSDESVDRMGDTIKASGWNLTDFENNPVTLWAHDSSAPPIGGASNVAVEGTRLLGNIAFAPPETYQFADTIYRLVLGKFLRAVSVGFMPTRHAFVQNDDARPWGIDFLEQDLLEISVCPVPANPNALQEARRKGIDTRPLVEWAERILDSGGVELKRTLISRDELQRLRTAAKEPSMTTRPRVPGHKRVPVRRDEGGNEVDPASGGAIVGNCGRAPDDQCGMTDASECSVHGGTRAEPDDDEKMLARIRRLVGRRKDGGEQGDDEPPVAHEDAIRLARKSLRTSKAYMAEGMTHHAKALTLLDGVADALDADADPITDPPAADPDPDADKAAQLRRAAELREKTRPA